MATAAQSAGDATSALRYLREADELQRGHPPGLRRVETAERGAGAGGRTVLSRVLWGLGFAVTALVGVGAGYAIGNQQGSPGTTTTPVTVTVTHNATATLTQPGTTVSETTTETTTITTTETVTTGAAPIP